MWSPDFIHIDNAVYLIGPYQGQWGWHSTRRTKKGEAQPDLTNALIVCRSYRWTGYIEWQQWPYMEEIEADACLFLKQIEKGKE